MATWKSNKITKNIDCFDDYVECDCHWEYQTTADVFSYHETVVKPSYTSYSNREVGSIVTNLHISNSTAKNLYHALSNWMKTYNSEEEMLEGIYSNIFKGE